MTRFPTPSISPRILVLLLGLGFGILSRPLAAQTQSPPPEPFKKVSTLVSLPDFVPGLGVLYVDPGTLPAGPFLAYDRSGALVSTIYMIPLDAIENHQPFAGLSVAKAPVDHVDINFNAGHPGVPNPHYHIVLWHVTKERAASLR